MYCHSTIQTTDNEVMIHRNKMYPGEELTLFKVSTFEGAFYFSIGLSFQTNILSEIYQDNFSNKRN